MRMFLLATAFALVAAPLPAAACSVTDSYHVPTNMELVADADLILLATVEGGTQVPDDPDASTDVETMAVEIGPVAALKGEIADAPRTLPVALAPRRFARPSDPYELRSAHPLAFIGGCVRYMVPRGSRLLFFLRRDKDQWVPAGGPFSRWAEDVLIDDAPWLQAVRFYIEVQALPEAERAAALTSRRDALRAKTDDPVAHLLADDIDRQLKGPNPSWNSEMRRMIGMEDPAAADEADTVKEDAVPAG